MSFAADSMETPPADRSRTCCLCSGADFHVIARRDRDGGPLITVMCCGCGLISHRDLPSEESLAEYYRSQYRVQYHGRARPSARRVMRAWKNGQRILALLRPHVPPGSRVLEIGAGLGCTVRSFQNAGYDAAGVDPGDEFTDFGVRFLKAALTRQTLDEIPAEPTRDLLLLVHVVEHLRCPDQALLKLRRLLKPGGVLYVECPNADGPATARGRLFHQAHTYNFTAVTLQLLAERCGFELLWSRPHADQPQLSMLFRRATARRRPVPVGSREHTLQRLRMSSVRYHLRPSYLRNRLRKLGMYAGEFLWARRNVRRLVADCALRAEQESAGDPVLLPFRGATRGPASHCPQRPRRRVA